MDDVIKIIKIPDDIKKGRLEEGFYQQTDNGDVFYFSLEGDNWYFQLYGDRNKLLVMPETPVMYVMKVSNRKIKPRRHRNEREFIESRLASLTEKTS